MMLGKQVKIKYGKSKFIQWEVEDILSTAMCITHKKVDEPCFVAENMDPTKINPVKLIFCSFSDRRNENLCRKF